MKSSLSLNPQKLIQNSQEKRRQLLKEMAPRRLSSWDWADKDFREGAQWVTMHPHEIRNGVYLSDTPNKEVWRITLPGTQGLLEVVIKYYQEPSLSWQSAFRHSIALNETLNYATLDGLGIPVAHPIACGEVRDHGRLKSSYIITKFIDNTIDGSSLMPTGPLADQQTLRFAFCQKALEIIARAHVCGFAHTEFHPHKILIGLDSSHDIQNLTLIDVARGSFRKTRSMRACIAIDLATFFIDLRLDAEEIKNLCQYYLNFNTISGFDQDSLWDAIASVDFSLLH